MGNLSMMNKFKILGLCGSELPIIFKQYAGGEYDVVLDYENAAMWDFEVAATIEAHIRNGDIMMLALVVDAVRELLGDINLILHLPYLPYARQDRTTEPGQAFSLKVFTKLLNTLPVDTVVINDCHSDVGIALVDKVLNIPWQMPEFVPVVDALIAPDFGATKKVQKAAKEFKIEQVIQAGKMRNVKTGELSGPVIFGNVCGKDVLVMDDICDGGRTFLQLATALKEAGANNLYLHVTHGIFSYGAKEKLREAGYEVTATYDWTEK
ncbi:hypothetical protein IACHDJAJ_00028 [Aeromonas phage vB_AdhS_TS3]|nr:hypothetical protein IACHDJAJ_00028 [Aeromonas phage vB_AdhS_TS3]